MALTIGNPELSAVHVATLSLDTTQGTGGLAVSPGHSSCSLSALSYVTQSNGGAGWTVPAATGSVDGSLSLDLAGALSMTNAAANACQGASFTVYLVAGP